MKKTLVLFVVMAGLLVPSLSAYSQKKKKPPVPMPPLPVADQIRQDIGEMLGAWQVGNVAAMHKYYADDATWVSGEFAPPIKGWQNYVAAYQMQFKRMSSPQLITRNMNIFHYGDVAWACYQWEFTAYVEGRSTAARGQTTLVLVKTNGHWLIVHNHTSEICPLAAPKPATAGHPGP